MKKILFITIIIFTEIFSVNAQKESGFEIGGNIGLNVSVVTNANGVRTVKNFTSFNIGASGEYYFSDRWGLKTKLILDNKGWGNARYFLVQNGNIYTSNVG